MSGADRAADLSPLQRALLALDEMKAKVQALQNRISEPIAVIGVGCRFPGASGPEAFWHLLRDGVDAVATIPSSRFDAEALYDPDADAPGKISTRWAGCVEGVDQFEPQLFGIAPREAAGMDPQHRLLLEVTWEALEHAVQAPDRLMHSSTGVFVGMCTWDYATLQNKLDDPTRIDAYSASGLAHSIASGRLSYTFGLQGPCMTVDTACSSSLVAVHLACQSLRNQECRMALAGGVHLMLGADNAIAFSRSRMLASDGRCKTFDELADGFVEGEGCGVVVLKRLSDAAADGDRVLAVIRGSAVNQDGPSSGLTAPNGPSQEAVLRAALVAAKLAPARIGYIEAHGTGTSLGDPIEVQALGAVFGSSHTAERPLIIGSVKTNLGHVQAAAGVAGLIKLVLALEHKEIPPNLHFTRPNSHIPWASLPVAVPTAVTAWQADGLRAGGVSAFGFSGTNAHIVVEEAPTPAGGGGQERPLHLLTVSARTESSLRESARRWSGSLNQPAAQIGNICFTANAGRAQLQHRVAMIVRDVEDARQQLAEVAAGQESARILRGRLPAAAPRVAFLFTGQGSQYVGMARALYDSQPTFRRTLDTCDEILTPLVGRSIRALMHGGPEDEAALNQTAYAQPAIFAVEYALAELWRSWGSEPTALLGHSLGEYAAACTAGVFSLPDGLALVAARGRLMQSLCAPGAMAAVMADETTLRHIIGNDPRLSIAAINAPDSVVVSGEIAAVEALVARLTGDGIRAERLSVSHAFHSAMMEPMLDEFERVANAVTFSAPKLRIVSNLTGDIARGDIATAAYWRRHIREAVLFSRGMERLRALECSVFLEIGPRPMLLGLGQRCVAGEAFTWVPSLRQGRDEWQQLLEAAGGLYVAGVNLDWRGFDRGYGRSAADLPTYPFDRRRYWFEPSIKPRRDDSRGEQMHPLLGRRLRSASDDVQFEALVDLEAMPFLADHAKLGTVIYPATCLLEIGAAAAEAVFGTGDHAVADLIVSQPLVLAPGHPVFVQTVLTDDGADGVRMRVYSRAEADDDAPWGLHATAVLTRAVGPAGASASLGEARAGCAVALDVAEYYSGMRDDGHEYGPSFQALTMLSRGSREALARVELPVELQSQSARFLLHPVLVDAAMQAIGAAIPAAADEVERGTYLPVSLDRFTVRRLREPPVALWGVARLRPVEETGGDVLIADVEGMDDTGATLFRVEGLCLKRVSKERLRAGTARVDELLYGVEWKLIDVPPAGARLPLSGRWIVVGEAEPFTADVVSQFARLGADVVQLARAECGSELMFRRAFEAVASSGVPVAGVVHFWSALAAAPPAAGLAVSSDAASLLACVQAMVASGGPESPRLYVFTRGAQPLGGELTGLWQSPALGLAKTIAVEHPELQCTAVDLDPGGGLTPDAIRGALAAPSSETQLAIRQNQLFVPRLRRLPAIAAQAGSAAVELSIAEPGVLERLTLQPLTRRAPAAGEVEVEVLATGLNFRDVLNALGMYEGPAGPLGSECVGRLSAVGAGVAEWTLGDEVLVTWSGTFKSFVTLPAAFVFPKPANLTVEEAATIPVAFLTADYALNYCAKMRAGDRVLIHAAAGGVGLAAVQLAQQAGAEIFATVGSPAKKTYLESLGIRHILNSRSLQFADDIMTLTNGEGVDVVLNSLAGDFIEQSLRVLREGGRFLELGKSGIWTAERVAASRSDVKYHAIYLGTDEAPVTRARFPQLLAAFEEGRLKPLPSRSFRMSEAADAYRFMAQARHIGKIVLLHDRAAAGASSVPVRADGTYLISGGLGALGLHVAEALVLRGARHLALMGRRPAGEDARGAIERLQAAGANVSVFAADVSLDADVRRVVASIDATMPPLAGIVHAAGVIDDGPIAEQSEERLQRVLAPKAAGSWWLHTATAARRLDFFVLFSSMVSVFGAAGQGTYAAANAFLDALAHYRRGCGLPALSVNWGPWADIGMAARLDAREHRQWSEQGISLLAPADAMAAFDRLMSMPGAQTAVLDIDWRRAARQWSAEAVPPFVSEVVRRWSAAPQAERRADVRAELASATPAERPGIIRRRVMREALKILGLTSPGDSIDPNQPLNELGLDSLMAVELRNALGAAVAEKLPATLLFRCPTVDALASHLVNVLKIHGDETRPEPAVPAEIEADQEAELADLDDDEVKRLLAEELASLPLSSATRDEW